MASDLADMPPPPRRLTALPGTTQAAIAALCLSAIPLLLAHIAFTPRYQTNDDAYMTMVASGAGVCDRPDPHLILINALLGNLLAWLYSQWPGLPWYRLTMIVIQLLASFTTYFSLLRGSLTTWRFFLCPCYMLGFDLYFHTNPQFTITAALVMQAGILAHLSWAEWESPSSLIAVFFGGAVAVSSIIRELSCLMILLLGTPVFAVPMLRALLQRRSSGKATRRFGVNLLRRAALLALGAAVYALIMLANRSAYRSGGWEGTFRYYDRLYELINYDNFPYNSRTKAIFDEAGWSHNDYTMLQLWGFIDRRLYSIENLETIISSYRKMARLASRSYLLSVPSCNSSTALKTLADVLGSEDGSGFRLVLLALLLVMVSGNRGRLLIAASTLFMGASLIVYLALIHDRCPPRVSLPILSYLACVLIWATKEPPNPLRWRFGSVGLLIFVLILSSFCWTYMVQMSRSSRSRMELTRCHELAIDALRKKNRLVFVDWAGSLEPELLSPWGGIERLSGLRLVTMNVFQRTPLVTGRLSEYGIEDLYKALYRRHDVWLLTNRLDPLVKTYKTFVREHYGNSVIVLKEQLLPDLLSTGCSPEICIMKFAKW